MKDPADRALDLAQTRGASYPDIRIVDVETQSIALKDGIVEGIRPETNQGFGVRVISDGACRLACSSSLEAVARSLLWGT